MRGAWHAALALAGAVAAWAASPISKDWTADPEEQFLLDVNIRQLRLGDGVRHIRRPRDLHRLRRLPDRPRPADEDRSAGKRASGWAFSEENKIDIDLTAGVARFAGSQEKLADGVWCARRPKDGVLRLGAGSLVQAWDQTGNRRSALMLESETKLPVELAVEREKRAAHIKPASMPLENLPKVRLPYRHVARSCARLHRQCRCHL
jgi:hypothetical protein